MRDFITGLKYKVLDGKDITYEEALSVIHMDEQDVESLEILFQGANEIREKYVGNKADLCTIMNVRSGRCTEDCTYCAQSAHYKISLKEYGLLPYEEVVKRALEVQSQGAHRFSLVTSGRGIENEEELERLVNIYKKLKEKTHIKLCASHGIISYEQAKRLKEAGVLMYHHNIETCESNYSNICTTHTYKERVQTIKNAMKAGLEVCCGGILGLGESKEDRVRMAFEIKGLGVTSVPLNVLMPIKGTPLENNKVLSPYEVLKTMALYRYILPNTYIRYAGGKGALEDKRGLGFKAGVNAALTGNYLTTIGSNIEEDKEMMTCVGLEI